MNTLTTEPEQEFDDLARDQLPGRPRRRLLTKLTVPLLGLLLAAAGFLGGIELEKSHRATSTATASASTATSALAKRFASGTAGSTSGAPPTGKSGSSKSSPRTGATRSVSGFPSAGSFGAAGGGTTGTISSISGKSFVLKTTSGNSITVTLTSATTLKKDLSVSRNSIRPGDTITVEGITGKGGSIKASSISDSGASSSTSSSSSAS